MPAATFTIANNLDELPRLDQEAAAFLEAADASPAQGYAVALAIEELVSNIIKYGYDDTLAHEIRVELAVEAGALRLSFLDDGHAFDPLAAKPPDLDLPVEERPIGGLGIHLVRQFFPDAQYHREAGQNRLDLRRPAEANAEPAG